MLPRTNTVTALELAHSSMTNIFSLVVPNDNSLTMPAVPSFSAVRSSNRGTIRPLVAMAMSSISGPPTHRTAGKSFCINKWLASSSKPHWQMTRLAPVSLTLRVQARSAFNQLKEIREKTYILIMSRNFSLSYSRSFLYSSTLSISNLCFVFGLGGSNGQVRIASLASLTVLGI